MRSKSGDNDPYCFYDEAKSNKTPFVDTLIYRTSVRERMSLTHSLVSHSSLTCSCLTHLSSSLAYLSLNTQAKHSMTAT